MLGVFFTDYTKIRMFARFRHNGESRGKTISILNKSFSFTNCLTNDLNFEDR